MKQVIVSVDSLGTRAVDVDDKFICFYTVKDNGEPSIIIPDMYSLSLCKTQRISRQKRYFM